MRSPIVLALFAAAWPAAAELPEFYKSADRIVWVVDDIDKTVAGWNKLSLIEVRSNGDMGPIRWSVARLGDTIVDLIEPISDEQDAFVRFHKKHGQGIMALMHRVPAEAAMDAEIARMKSQGVGVLQGGPIGEDGDRYVLFDTEAEGKYSVGLIYSASPEYSNTLAAPAAKPGAQKITQYAFAVKDLDAVSKYWAKLGWPAMQVTHPETSELRLRGKPAAFDMQLGWHRHGKVPYEWILSTKGPNVYEDHMRTHGEGFHHIAFNTADMDQEIAKWEQAGYAGSQAGAWGEKGKPGSGRFSYHDTQAIGGTDVELLWNFKK